MSLFIILSISFWFFRMFICLLKRIQLVFSLLFSESKMNILEVQPFLASPLEKVSETFLQSVDQLQAAVCRSTPF